jgi:hypothetical protein
VSSGGRKDFAMLKRLLPPLGHHTLLSEEADVGLVKRLWTLKMVDGCEIGAVLLFDSTLGAEIKIPEAVE